MKSNNLYLWQCLQYARSSLISALDINAAYDPNAGEKSIIFIPIIILQHLIGMISFAVLRSHYRRKLFKER